MGNHYWNAVNGREFQLPLGASSVPLGKRGALPPPPIPAPGRETTLPRMGGNYENSQWFRSLSAHENTQRGESAYGLPLVFDGLLPRSNAFLPPRRYGFFLFLSNLVQLNLTLFFFFFFWFEFFLFVWFLIDYLFHVVFFFLSIFDIIRGWKKGTSCRSIIFDIHWNRWGGIFNFFVVFF